MENELRLLTETQIDWLAKYLDDAFDFNEIIKNKIAGIAVEALDSKLFKISLNFADAKASPFIPDEYKDELSLAIDDVMDGDHDFKVAVDNAIKVIDELKEKLDVKPWVKNIIDSSLELIKAAINAYLEFKMQENSKELAD
jgi:hypothetical protein